MGPAVASAPSLGCRKGPPKPSLNCNSLQTATPHWSSTSTRHHHTHPQSVLRHAPRARMHACSSVSCRASRQPKQVPGAYEGTSQAGGASLSSAWARASADGPDWPAFLSALALLGATGGTLLDGIHSRMSLQVYDLAPIVVGGLNTSGAVPPLLAAFYVVLGALHPLLDNLNPGPETGAARAHACSGPVLALSFGVLAAFLHLSATLYAQGVPYWQIHVILGAAAAANFLLFDGTRQGLLLGLVCGLGAPAAELLINGLLVQLWHYPRGDLLGGAMVSWVPWCYFAYTPALGNLARWLWARCRSA